MAESTAGRRLEWAATVLLAVAAVATAWSSYQATRWNGEQAKAASRTNGFRIEAARAQGEAEAQTQVDVATFIQWVDAHLNDEQELQDFYEERFRDEFQPAFQAWLASDPFTNPNAPPTPFGLDEYQLEARAQVEQLDQQALFFAGISAKLDSPRPRTLMVCVGWLVFLGALAWVVTMPVSFDL
jgi:hypothetical protein